MKLEEQGAQLEQRLTILSSDTGRIHMMIPVLDGTVVVDAVCALQSPIQARRIAGVLESLADEWQVLKTDRDIETAKARIRRSGDKLKGKLKKLQGGQ